MKINNAIVLGVALVVLSCNDEISPQQQGGIDFPGGGESITLNNEDIYRIQTDKNVMINSLIRYDSVNKKYVLDISTQDADRIGITSEMYENAQKRVEKMNEIGKEHL